MESGSPRTASRYIAGLQQMLAAEGVEPAALLAGSGVDQARLDDPSGYLSLTETDRILENALRLGQPMPGLRLGRRLNISAHGSAGLAGLTAADTREALEVATRYFPLITETISLSLAINQRGALITILPAPQLPEQVRDFVIQTLFSSVSLMAGFLLGERAAGLRLSLPDTPDPELLAGLPELRNNTQFAAAEYLIALPGEVLDTPFALADATAHKQALARCEAELNQLQRVDGLAERLYQQMLADTDQLPSLEQLAADMNISSRTLHRRLAAEGRRFRDLQAAARIARAEQLLKQGMSITEIAHQLGYGDAANFTRAFRRHRGVPPSRL